MGIALCSVLCIQEGVAVSLHSLWCGSASGTQIQVVKLAPRTGSGSVQIPNVPGFSSIRDVPSPLSKHSVCV